MSDWTERIVNGNSEYRIEQDQIPLNPFEEWDALPITFTEYDNSYSAYQNKNLSHRTSLRAIKNDLWERFAPHRKTRKLEKAILDVVGTTCKSLADYHSRWDYGTKNWNYDSYNDYLDEMVGLIDLSNLQEVYEFTQALFDNNKTALKKHFVYTHKSIGYQQGDVSQVVFIYDKNFFDVSGCKPSNISGIFNDHKEIYDAWAWGDVHYINEIVDGEPHGDNSCGGFYGINHARDYLCNHLKITLKEYNKRCEYSQ